MRKAFEDEVYRPLELGSQVWIGDITSMADGDKILIKLNFGKVDDGYYIIERKKGTLYFYRMGHFNKILIYKKGELIASLTKNQFKKRKGLSGALSYTKRFPRFFAKN